MIFLVTTSKAKRWPCPPMTFTVNKVDWEALDNRLPSRHISVVKHAALNQMIDDLLDLQVIQPSRAAAWSQVHLVCKPTNGWRFTVDFHNLNKVISNEGWQIPNMKEMIKHIGSLWPSRFAIADLSSGFFLPTNLVANTRHSSPSEVFTNGPEYQWAFCIWGPCTLSNFPQKKVWAYTYSTASSITYVSCTLTTCLFLDQKTTPS